MITVDPRVGIVAVAVLLVLGIVLIVYGEEVTQEATARAARNASECANNEPCSSATIDFLGGWITTLGAVILTLDLIPVAYVVQSARRRRRAPG